jgi:CHAT domain-containing protein
MGQRISITGHHKLTRGARNRRRTVESATRARAAVKPSKRGKRVADLKVGLLFYLVDADAIYVTLLDQDGRTETFRLLSYDEAFPRIDRLFDVIHATYSPSVRNATFQDFSFGWGRQLLPSDDALKAYDVLVIIPHHSLHGLPLHTIWVNQGFLATSHGVTYCSSGTLFRRCVDRNPIRQGDLSTWRYAVGENEGALGPSPPATCLSASLDVKEFHSAQYRALAETFARHFADARVGDAERPFLKLPLVSQKLGREVMCIVCHGHYDRTHPDNSGLLVAFHTESPLGHMSFPVSLGEGEVYHFSDLPFTYFPFELHSEAGIEPDIISVAELKVECKTSAELVALLGCSTGAGHMSSGDDFDSLAYQFLKLGAASALANLWDLDLAFASKWVPLFLENWLHKRQPKALAWKYALTEFLDERNNAAQYEWGVLALTGDWL